MPYFQSGLFLAKFILWFFWYRLKDRGWMIGWRLFHWSHVCWGWLKVGYSYVPTSITMWLNVYNHRLVGLVPLIILLFLFFLFITECLDQFAHALTNSRASKLTIKQNSLVDRMFWNVLASMRLEHVTSWRTNTY